MHIQRACKLPEITKIFLLQPIYIRLSQLPTATNQLISILNISKVNLIKSKNDGNKIDCNCNRYMCGFHNHTLL